MSVATAESRTRTAPLVAVRQRAGSWLGSADAAERVALAAVILTPLALFADYRLGAALVDDLVEYRPIGESGGRLVSYHQLLGWTQVVWLGAGAVALASGATRRAYRSLPAVILALLLGFVIAVTAFRGGVDRTTVVSLGATLLPLVCMMALLASPGVRQSTRRLLVSIFATECALVVVVSLAKKGVDGRGTQRLEAFAFGPPPELGLVLAGVTLLSVAALGSTWFRGALVGIAGAGLLLTQTRGAILGAVVGSVVLGLLLPRLRWVIAGIVAISATAFALTTSRSLTFGDLSTSYRRQNLAHHWELFEREPLFGYGVNDAGVDAVRAAHSALLELANAAGVVAAALLVLALVVPIVARLRRGPLDVPAAAGISVVVATVVGWHTTGTQILIYNPPTNFLPLVLAIGLLEPPALGRRAR